MNKIFCDICNTEVERMGFWFGFRYIKIDLTESVDGSKPDICIKCLAKKLKDPKSQIDPF